MKSCRQTPTQTILEHGESVWATTNYLLSIMRGAKNTNQYPLPKFFELYLFELNQDMLDDKDIETYTTYHDLSKPFIQTIDEFGKTHFPNHAEESARLWTSIGGNYVIAHLMKNDMVLHACSAADIPDFIDDPYLPTQLIVALAEIISNAQLFGGFESSSFKAKFKQISRRGNQICKILYGEKS
jgi:hypothetical protein